MDDQTPPTEMSTPPEPSGASAPVTPVTATSSASITGRAGRGRWIVAGAVVVLAVAVTVGAMLLFGKSSTPSALQYIPADAAFVAELRMDLPGDQLQHLGNLLAHFPGFADQSTLGTKIDESMKKLFAMDGQTALDYATVIKPWLDGPAFVAVMTPSVDATSGHPGHGVLSATTTTTASCAAIFTGQTVSHDSYRGLDLTLSADGALACVLDGRQGLIGDPATVRLALDAKAGGTGMDTSARYAAARAALGLDRLATMYVSGAALSQLMPAGTAMPGLQDLTALTGPVPDWTIAGVRAEDEALVIDTVAAPVVQPANGPSLLPLPATHASVLAPMVPASTLVFAESQGSGVALQNLLNRLQSIPELSSAFQMLDGMGGASQLVGWIDDAGLAVDIHGTDPDVALMIVANDEAAASSRVAALRGLLALTGGSAVKLTPGTVNGVDYTTITITDLGAFVPAGSVPGLTIPESGPISFSIAARGKVVIVTSGDVAMGQILGVQPGTSLADDATFKLAAQRGLANSRTTIYVAAGAVVDLAPRFMSADELATFKSDVLPYLDPLTSVAVSAAEDATANRSRIVVSVTKP